ncbi:DUF2975 domain-containing protein [Heyndrickxia sp. NPDC080065]|uniref:DUF2975 domain-containing protein n=1 Tax=Heyndrickxia sp. NPDC080065 TaxID=3390568 RepID=UPI003CFDA247
MKQGSITSLKVALFLIGFIILSLCIFALPSLASYAAKMNPEFSYFKYPVLYGLYMTAVPFFFALYQAFKLLTCIESNNAFSEIAVGALSRIKYCAATVVILYVLGIFMLGLQNALHPGIAIVGLLIIFTAFVISLFSAVLQELFKNALKLKVENELTV